MEKFDIFLIVRYYKICINKNYGVVCDHILKLDRYEPNMFFLPN